LQFGHGALHHAGQVFERTPDGGPRFHRFELALEFLNLAKALANDLGVLFVERLEAFQLALFSLRSDSTVASSSA
jgi:hypothetical protein